MERVRERFSVRAGVKRDFRTNLVSTFVDNLNSEVDLRSLWGIFKQFGVVRDIYLSPKSRFKRSSFAFVRFASKEEAVRFVGLTDSMLVYGWRISLKISSVDWRSMSKEMGKPFKMSNKGGGIKQYEVRTSKKVFNPMSGDSYPDAMRGL
ncbi:hypothetical protein LWI28_005364 [Acer negundo]|uniref:RRM domain-containing protein n=1 Tax=Acer negundo TaxID=4023 RepID=A0AAD5JIZ7_ACENE|nr:hypothetical protein LWI28_005364 [Acer negundo]